MFVLNLPINYNKYGKKNSDIFVEQIDTGLRHATPIRVASFTKVKKRWCRAVRRGEAPLKGHTTQY